MRRLWGRGGDAGLGGRGETRGIRAGVNGQDLTSGNYDL